MVQKRKMVLKTICNTQGNFYLYILWGNKLLTIRQKEDWEEEKQNEEEGPYILIILMKIKDINK